MRHESKLTLKKVETRLFTAIVSIWRGIRGTDQGGDGHRLSPEQKQTGWWPKFSCCKEISPLHVCSGLVPAGALVVALLLGGSSPLAAAAVVQDVRCSIARNWRGSRALGTVASEAVCCLVDWTVEVGWGKVSELGARLVQLSGTVSLVKWSLSAGDFEPPTVTQPTGLGVDEVATTVVLAFKALTV